MSLSQEQLWGVLDYNPETGLFKWKVRTSIRVVVGAVAGSVSDDGYIVIRIGRKIYRAHRLAFLWMTGKFPTGHVDHINTIRTDNRWCNLRQCSRSQNQCNRTKQSNNTSGFKGVSFEKRTGLWKAGLGINRKFINLGRFKTPELAHAAYCQAVEKHHKEFARVR